MPEDPFQTDADPITSVSPEAGCDSECGVPETAPEVDPAGRRLLIALILFLILGAVALVLALAFEIVIPPVLFFACVAMLIVGVLVGNPPERRAHPPRLGDAPGDRPVGCCPGPRPLGERRRR